MMTAEQLKASILQLAMQGKLVEQRLDEGTGEELYKEIQTEKKRLLKEGLLKKQKPLLEITEEEMPFDIPESWKWVKLGDISSYAQPKEKMSPKDITPEMWSLNLEDIEKGTGKVLNHVLAKERKIRGDKVRFKKGNILYSKLRPYLLKILIADKEGITTPELVPFYIYGINDSIFFLWYLRSPYVDNTVNSVSYGVKMPRVGTETMVNLLVPLPPFAEQKRIVAKIEELMPFVEQYAAASTMLNTLNASFPETMKKSILQEAVQGKLVPQDPNDEPASVLLERIAEEKKRLIREGKIKKQKPLPAITENEIPFDIPESWEWVRLLDLAIAIVDCPHSTPKYLDEKTGYFALGTKGIGEEGIIRGFFNIDKDTYLKRIERLEPRGNDIVYSREGSIICRAAILPNNKKICLGQRVMLIRCPQSVSVGYLQQYLMADSTVAILTKNYKGVGVKHINVADVSNLLVPIPPMNEQNRIVDKIKQMIPLIRKMNTK